MKETFMICPYIPDHEMSKIRQSQDPIVQKLYSAIVHMSADYDQMKDDRDRLQNELAEAIAGITRL